MYGFVHYEITETVTLMAKGFNEIYHLATPSKTRRFSQRSLGVRLRGGFVQAVRKIRRALRI
jgi:hypothetical protein